MRFDIPILPYYHILSHKYPNLSKIYPNIPIILEVSIFSSVSYPVFFIRCGASSPSSSVRTEQPRFAGDVHVSSTLNQGLGRLWMGQRNPIIHQSILDGWNMLKPELKPINNGMFTIYWKIWLFDDTRPGKHTKSCWKLPSRNSGFTH